MVSAVQDAVERRDFIRRVATLLGMAAVAMPPVDALEHALTRRARIGPETVDQVERVTVALQSLGPTEVSSRLVLEPVTGHLSAIVQLLRGSLAPSVRARLCSLAAETAGCAGWLRWDMDDPGGAARYFAAGLDATREAGDRALAAYLAGSAACQPPYRERPWKRLHQLEAAGWPDATPSTRTWLAAKQADAHALLGDAGGCLRALERAEHALGEVPGEGESRRPRFSAVDHVWLDGERGASLARLGRTSEARATLQSALARLAPANERDRLWLGTALASTYVQDGEPEEACRVAADVLERANRMQLDPVLKVVENLHRQLQARCPHPAVSDLDERLRLTSVDSGRGLTTRFPQEPGTCA